MKPAIFTFSKPSAESTVATNRLALFISAELNLPLVWDESIADQKLDTLIIINGAYAFCKCLPALGAAVERAKRIIWVQQDYTIKPPSPDSAAESPFRKAFRVRKGEPLHYWTTCERNAASTPLSRYVNWNQLTWAPLSDVERDGLRKRATRDLFYYGAYRANRVEYFDRYFTWQKEIPVTISSTSGKFLDYVGGAGAGTKLTSGINRGGFFQELARHGLGLYIEDRKSHVEFHSPANRFYEMLSAGLPMVFQPESVGMLAKAGFDVADYVVSDNLPSLMRRREQIGLEQRQRWNADYVGNLRRRLRQVWKEAQK